MPGAAAFDGVDDRIDVPAAGPNQAANWTVALWFIGSLADPAQDFATIFFDDFGLSGFGALYWRKIEGQQRMELWQNAAARLTSAVDSAQPDTWHYVAVTHDGTNGRLYVNGVLEATTAYGSQTLRNVTHVIGGNNAGNFLLGRITQVKIWNKTLSADELANERWWAVPSNRRSQDLLLWYPLWESSRGTAFDHSGRGNNGTDVNGPTTGEGPPIRMSRGGQPHVLRPLVAGQVFSETVQVGPIVISPAVRALLSGVDKPSPSFVISPASKDIASLVERPIRVFAIIPSASAGLSFTDRPQAAIVVSPSAKDVAALVDKPQVGPVIVSPASRDIAALSDRPQATAVIAPAVRDIASFVERTATTLAIVAVEKDMASMVDRPQPTLIISPSVRDTAAFVETRQIGPIIILPTVFDTLGAAVFNEIVQATITILSTARDRAEFVDRPAATVVVAPSVVDARSLIESLSSPFAVVPSVKDIAAFVDRPVGAIVVVPSVSDIFTPGGQLAETVLATIKILVGIRDDLVHGPVFSAGGRRQEVSGRVLVVSKGDGRIFEVGPRGTREVTKR